MEATENKDKVVYWGTGRRKSAVARVRLVPGSGEIVVNKKPGNIYFNRIPSYLQNIQGPLETLGLESDYDPRAKERKKYGLHKARKAPQYSKR